MAGANLCSGPAAADGGGPAACLQDRISGTGGCACAPWRCSPISLGRKYFSGAAGLAVAVALTASAPAILFMALSLMADLPSATFWIGARCRRSVVDRACAAAGALPASPVIRPNLCRSRYFPGCSVWSGLPSRSAGRVTDVGIRGWKFFPSCRPSGQQSSLRFAVGVSMPVRWRQALRSSTVAATLPGIRLVVAESGAFPCASFAAMFRAGYYRRIAARGRRADGVRRVGKLGVSLRFHSMPGGSCAFSFQPCRSPSCSART